MEFQSLFFVVIFLLIQEVTSLQKLTHSTRPISSLLSKPRPTKSQSRRLARLGGFLPTRRSKFLRGLTHKIDLTLKTSDGPTIIDKEPLRVIIAGAPAAGKGTQCENIKNKFGVIHLSTGDILRAAVKSGTKLGLQAKGYMDEGQLVPDQLIIDVVLDRLKEEDCMTKGWLLDGFPRTPKQAEALSKSGMVPDAFILLDVDENVLVERVTGRRTDPETGTIYHMKFNPPETEEIASRLIQRSDDTEEKIVIRYKEFQSNIDGVKSFYEDKMIWVDGGESMDVVMDCVISSLNSAVSEKQ